MNINGKKLESIDTKDIVDGVLIIPEGIEEINAGAVSDWNLNKVILPDSMTNLRIQSKKIISENVVGDSYEYNIEKGVFEGCSFRSIILSKYTEVIGEQCFKDSNLEDINIPDNVKKIRRNAFTHCAKLTNIILPDEIEEIPSGKIYTPEFNYAYDQYTGSSYEFKGAFEDCTSLEKISLPTNLREIDYSAFKNCSSLQEIKIPPKVTFIGGNAFSGCKSLKNVVFSENVEQIGCGAFKNCLNLEKISLPTNLDVISDLSFENCKSLQQIEIPPKVTVIGEKAFSGCESLKSIIIPKSVENAGKNIFKNCLNLEHINIPNEKIANALAKGYDYTTVTYDENMGIILEKKEKVNKDNKFIPAQYLTELIKNNSIKQFLADSDFKAFNSNIENSKSLIENNNLSDEEKFDFFKFAVSFGCFSKDKFLDKNGVPTEATVGQKASTLFAQLIKNDGFKIGDFHGLFDSLSINTRVNQNFIKFLAPQGKDFGNLNLLLDMEEEYPGIFTKVMSNFNEVEKYRIMVDDTGRNKTVPWNEAINAYYYSEKYEGIDEENRDIAIEYSSHGIDEKLFNRAVKLRQKAKENDIPEHILGKELKEKNIMQQIEDLQGRTEEQLGNAKIIVDELYKKTFTYEWLNKYDAKNGIIGIYASCCANLKSSAYGKNIAEKTITAKDVQNLVVRNNEGKIIAKGTLYVNEENGYGVFNDFEINDQFKDNQINENENEYEYGGIYAGDEKKEEELTGSELKRRKDRDMIFGALIRGMNAFVEEYDKQHPDKPMMQINVGMGYNRLKRNVKEFCEVATENLTVPAEYCFRDAEYKQYVLYSKEIKKEEIEEEKRENITDKNNVVNDKDTDER